MAETMSVAEWMKKSVGLSPFVHGRPQDEYAQACAGRLGAQIAVREGRKWYALSQVATVGGKPGEGYKECDATVAAYLSSLQVSSSSPMLPEQGEQISAFVKSLSGPEAKKPQK